MTPEARVQEGVEISAPSFESRLLRNNSGALKNEDGVMVRYGLGNISSRVNKQIKSSDLIGWTSVVITPEMVGKKVAIFTAIEVKPETFKINPPYRPNSREWAQEKFVALVRDMGGFGAIVNSEGYYHMVMEHFTNSLKA